MPVRKIKYLGGSHVRRLESGEDFGGRLGTPLPEALEWNLANNHLVEADLPDDMVQLLLSEPASDAGIGDKEFVDVTNESIVPTSLGQRRWRSIRDDEHPVDTYEPSQDPRVRNATNVTRTAIPSPASGTSTQQSEGDVASQ